MTILHMLSLWMSSTSTNVEKGRRRPGEDHGNHSTGMQVISGSADGHEAAQNAPDTAYDSSDDMRL